jgi:hypothetical protein
LILIVGTDCKSALSGCKSALSGASAIYRADASYKGFNIFAAATVHGLQTSPVSSNVTTHSGETIVSMGLRVGVGYNFGR